MLQACAKKFGVLQIFFVKLLNKSKIFCHKIIQWLYNFPFIPHLQSYNEYREMNQEAKKI